MNCPVDDDGQLADFPHEFRECGAIPLSTLVRGEEIQADGQLRPPPPPLPRKSLSDHLSTVGVFFSMLGACALIAGGKMKRLFGVIVKVLFCPVSALMSCCATCDTYYHGRLFIETLIKYFFRIAFGLSCLLVTAIIRAGTDKSAAPGGNAGNGTSVSR